MPEPMPGTLARDLQIVAIQLAEIANLEKRGLTQDETRTLAQHIRAASQRALMPA
jgi:uncharacterized membrane protein